MFTPECNNEIRPYKGKTFTGLDEAIDFYTNYGKEGGFDIRMSSGTKVGDLYTWRTIVCSRQGLKNAPTEDVLIENGNGGKKRRRPSFRCECPAKIVLKFVAGIGYVIKEFIEQHNHMLVQVEDKRFMRINRKLDIVQQMFVLDCAKAGIGPTNAHRLLKELLGGDDYVGCTVIDVRNFARDLKAYTEGSDAQMLLNEMKKKKELCDAFTYEVELDASDKLKRLFWCDPISKRNYHYFGDVVAFDTTYSTNKYVFYLNMHIVFLFLLYIVTPTHFIIYMPLKEFMRLITKKKLCITH